MEIENAVTFQTRTRRLFRMRSILSTLQKGLLTMDTSFKIVTGAPNHTGVAIFQYGGYAIHVTPNQDGEASSVVIYPVDNVGLIERGTSVFGPVSATLSNLCTAKEVIDNLTGGDILNDDTGLFPLPAFQKEDGAD